MLHALARTVTVVSIPIVALACGGQTAGPPGASGGTSAALGMSMASCPSLAPNVTAVKDGKVVITKVCMKDELGHYYDAELSDTAVPAPGLPVLPAGRKYSIVYQFGDGWVPGATTTTGARAYAAPDNIYNRVPGTLVPENSESNRVGSTSTIDANLLTQELPDIVPSGEQVVSVLDFSVLYPSAYSCASRGTPTGGCAGFSVRFYVGSPPPCQGTASCTPSGGI
jgi:hypothetical protein